MRTIKFAVAAAISATLASGAFSGSPDNPGAGGQAVKEAVAATKAAGGNWSETVSEFTKNGGNLGQAIQDVKEALGGDPNPANDNGGGND